MFRHHLETKVDDIKELKNTTYINLRNTEALRGIIKTRINNLGNIVYIGEY
jgi:CRISPR-associated endonuclease Csn1